MFRNSLVLHHRTNIKYKRSLFILKKKTKLNIEISDLYKTISFLQKGLASIIWTYLTLYLTTCSNTSYHIIIIPFVKENFCERRLILKHKKKFWKKNLIIPKISNQYIFLY